MDGYKIGKLLENEKLCKDEVQIIFDFVGDFSQTAEELEIEYFQENKYESIYVRYGRFKDIVYYDYDNTIGYEIIECYCLCCNFSTDLQYLDRHVNSKKHFRNRNKNYNYPFFRKVLDYGGKQFDSSKFYF
jgi:hypothetical protein